MVQADRYGVVVVLTCNSSMPGKGWEVRRSSTDSSLSNMASRPPSLKYGWNMYFTRLFALLPCNLISVLLLLVWLQSLMKLGALAVD